ncbi:UNVERIFIED_CONTAM: DUF2714 domain-containing protein [Campylobacter lari]
MKKSTNKNTINVEQLKYENMIFNNYNKVVADERFISNKAFHNQFLLENNLDQNNHHYQNLLKQINEYLNNKDEIAFNKFIISFTRDIKFSMTSLVPTITYEIDHKTKTLNLKNSLTNKEYDSILNNFNKIIYNLVFDKKLFLEIIPGIVIVLDSSNLLKIFFSKRVFDAY